MLRNELYWVFWNSKFPSLVSNSNLIQFLSWAGKFIINIIDYDLFLTVRYRKEIFQWTYAMINFWEQQIWLAILCLVLKMGGGNNKTPCTFATFFFFPITIEQGSQIFLILHISSISESLAACSSLQCRWQARWSSCASCCLLSRWVKATGTRRTQTTLSSAMFAILLKIQIVDQKIPRWFRKKDFVFIEKDVYIYTRVATKKTNSQRWPFIFFVTRFPIWFLELHWIQTVNNFQQQSVHLYKKPNIYPHIYKTPKTPFLAPKMIFMHRKWYVWLKMRAFGLNIGRRKKTIFRLFGFGSFGWRNPIRMNRMFVCVSILWIFQRISLLS